jgi:hypothetical protein
MTTGSDRQLWTCPKCGHAFVTANLWHSCGRFELDDHFRDRPPERRVTFDAFADAVTSCGPVTVYAQKTRIVCQVRVRFGSAYVRRRWIDVALWLRHREDHRCLIKVETYGPKVFMHVYRLENPADVDDGLRAHIAAAYVVGCQTG